MSQQENLSGRSNKDWLLQESGILTWSLVSYVLLVNFSGWQDRIIAGIALVTFMALFLRVTLSNTKMSINQFLLLLLVLLLITYSLIYFDTNRVAPILLVMIASLLATHLNKQQALLCIFIINTIFYFILTFSSDQEGFFTVLIFAFLQVFAFSNISTSLREQAAKEELSAINQELQATRYLLKESSKRQERLRISRDLHDRIGHQLTALSLNLEVAKHQVPDEYREVIEQNLNLSKQLLTDVRDVVKEMRTEDDFDLVGVIQGLFDELPNCQLTIGDFPKVNSLQLKQQLVYCLQEGISNALRHGKANQITLYGEKQSTGINIHLIDNGKGCQKVEKGSGLLGMQERLASFKGQAALVSTDAGCQLNLTMEDSYD